jgi:DNA-binding FrmR family transcriptional regulator
VDEEKVSVSMSQPVDERAAREKIAKRLSRIAGHATSLKRLWEEGRQIDDMLTQVAAVRAALDQVGRAMLELHIDESVAKAAQNGESAEAIRELKEALDRFI